MTTRILRAMVDEIIFSRYYTSIPLHPAPAPSRTSTNEKTQHTPTDVCNNSCARRALLVVPAVTATRAASSIGSVSTGMATASGDGGRRVEVLDAARNVSLRAPALRPPGERSASLPPISDIEEGR